MGGGDVERRAPRSSTRNSSESKRPRSTSRSRSVSSRSDRSRSRSRSRERAPRSRRSRSRSKPRHSSRRSRRSRSRSTSRDRSRRERHRSSRRRDRSRDRRRRGSGRKRSRRDRSRSTEGHHRSTQGDEDRERRQRRRRDSDAVEAEPAKPPGPTQPAEVPAVPLEKTGPTREDVTKPDQDPVGVEKEETSTSQDSIATSTATAAASSQSETETKTPAELPQDPDRVRPTEETANKGSNSNKPPVDVKSIKMDILKALADARSTIAGIKGTNIASVTQIAAPTPAQVNQQPIASSSPMAQRTEMSESKTEIAQSAGTVDVNPSSLCSSPAAPAVASTAAPSAETTESAKKEVAAADVDEFDMFSAADLHGADLPLSPLAGPAAVVVTSTVQSNYDDADGYYKPSIGEVLNSKYRVLGTVGKGVFSIVLRCQRIAPIPENEPEMVAIKLIRNNEVMRDASQTEIKILTEISERDPRDKKHCVRLLDRFEHRNHVALVFESMQMNVREAMKKFGGKGGISIQAVRIFCKHMLIALSHLESCGVVHADIKPDNVLLDEKQTMVKLCDFGSAFESNEGKHDPTPYLVSRFYRAPEIVLGLPYDKAVDMWSVGCCLYEMFTGKVMFPGATNNEMLKLFMELKGKVPNKIIKKHRQAYIEQLEMEPHFTEDNKFRSHELDRVTGKPVLRLMDAVKTRFDLGSALLGAKSSTDDRKQVLELRNLLERMFTLDPSKRITPKEALGHPFVKTEGKQAMS